MITKILVGIGILALITIGALSFSVVNPNEIVFFVSQAGSTAPQIKPITGDFQFGDDCEVIKPQAPSVDLECVRNKLDQSGQKSLNFGINNDCVSTSVNHDGKTVRIEQGRPLNFEGYSLLLEEINGDFTVTQTELVKRGFNAKFRIILDNDALKTELLSNHRSLQWNKKLASCVKSGITILDSPRILGGTVIDNKDGTFTSLGHVIQQELIFENTKQGIVKVSPSSQQGGHSLIIKPFIVVNNQRMQILPEQKIDSFRELDGTFREITPQERLEPSISQKISAWFKNIWGKIRGT